MSCLISTHRKDRWNVQTTQQGFLVDDCASDDRGALSERSEFANTVIHRRTGGRRKRSVSMYHPPVLS